MRRLDAFEIRDAAADAESLIACLRAVVCWAGRDVSYDELMSVSGVAAMFTSSEREACPARWNDAGRDAFLIDAARQYGLDVREFHPPEAAPLPVAPPEFEWHFRDSYWPLIEAAIAHGQPVLAWRGWQAPHGSDWGVITRVDAARQTCAGYVPGRSGAPTPLIGAAVQVYVVQAHEGGEVASESARVAAAIVRCRDVLMNRSAASSMAVTGPDAIRRWRERLERPLFCDACGADSWRCLRSMAIRLWHNRARGTAWFRAIGRAGLAERFGVVAERVMPACEESFVRRVIASADARSELGVILDGVIDAETALLDVLTGEAQ
ncbi:MAG: hypothetical protein L6Q92_13865 [Phycisphaerae bacterium]|nr:hypothetical protein [Phycisphaerae bacterium]